MARIQVKNMSRRQQKAVFANMGNPSGSTTGRTKAEQEKLANDYFREDSPKSDRRILLRYRTWQRKHPNFITPQLVKAKVNRERKAIIEISRGTDFDRNPMYGVTVIKQKGDSFETTMGKENKSFTGKNARQEAELHFKKLL